MKRKEKKVLYFGENFQEKKGIYNINNVNLWDFKGLSQCFSRWSDEKDKVYYYYEKLLKENTEDFNSLYYGIKSYNQNIITLHAIVKKDSKKYYLYITPSYNYFEEIEED